MCGIAGVVAKEPDDVLIRMTITMMMVLQTRGDEGCGIACSDGYLVKIEKGAGRVSTFFNEAKIETLELFKPLIVMGHNLYTTSGSIYHENIHPQSLKLPSGKVAFAYNGNVPGITKKKDPLKKKGLVFFSDGDTEFILDYIFEAAGRQLRNLVQGIKEFMLKVPCTYSASLMVREKLFLFRDPYANRPLFYGLVDKKIIVYASEDSALWKIGASDIKEVEPGTIVELGIDGTQKIYRVFSKSFCQKNCAHCVFCGIYFARPDSNIFGNLRVDVFRQRLGAALYRQCGVSPDTVTSVPASGDQGSVGYAIACQSPFQILLLRDPSIHRTFISAGQRNREQKAKLKYGYLLRLIDYYNYKTIMIIDDSIVRSTTMKVLIGEFRREVLQKLERDIKIYVGVLSPPIKHPCFYGIDMKDKGELVAVGKDVEQIRQAIGVDGLYYLNLDNLKATMCQSGLNPENYCMACFDGHYPISLK